MAVDTSPANSARELEIIEESDDERDSENEEERDNSREEARKDDESKDDQRKRHGSDSDSRNGDSSARGNADDNKLKIWTSSSDVKAIRSRVFIGHLNTDRATRYDVEKLFEKCGKINAISMLSGYGFVQYNNEESARKAIDKYHGTVFFNTKLVVDKPAAWKRLDGENPRDPKPWPKDSRNADEDDRRSHSSSSRHRREHYHDRHESRYDSVPARYRDPGYERYLEMRYMEERLAERYRYADRFYDRYMPPQPPGRYGGEYLPGHRGYDYPAPSRGYDYPRDDDYESERRPFDYSYR